MTKGKPRLITYGMFSDLMLSLIVFLTVQSALMFAMYGYISTLDIDFKFLVIPIFYAASFLVIRRFRMGQKLMIISHLVFLVSSLAAISIVAHANGAEKLTVVISAILQMIYSLKQRYNSKDFVVKSEVLYLCMTVNIIAFCVISYFNKAEFVRVILMNTVLVVTLFFIARQSNVLDVSYYHSLRSETQNVNSVKKQNRMSILLIVLGIGVSLFMLYGFPADEVTKGVLSAIKALLRLLFSILPQDPDAPEASQRRLILPYENDDLLATEPPMYLKIIVLFIFLFVVVSFFISAVAAIKALLSRYGTASEKGIADSDGAVVDLIENVRKSGKGERRRLDFGKGYEKEVRKKFYQKVKKGMKEGLPLGRTSTPRDIERILSDHGDNSISDLTDRYEKVRYRKEDLT